MPTCTPPRAGGGGRDNDIAERRGSPFSLSRRPSRHKRVQLRLVPTATVPESPEFASFLSANREAIAPIALLGRRLERGEIDTRHALAALTAIVELFRQSAP